MNILFDVSHPAHVHLVRESYRSLDRKGHSVFVTTRDSRIINDLLTAYSIPFIIIGSKKKALLAKFIEQCILNVRMFFFVRKNKIDIGVHGITVAHVSKISRMKSILLDDDDDMVEPLFSKYGHPLCDTILSPDCITRKSKKNVSYAGTHELAYLHPAHFTPDPSVLGMLGVEPGEKYFIVRFVAFQGHHDIGQHGLSVSQKRQLINLLLRYGKVFITSEKPVEPEFERYRVPVPPEKIHSVMAYADMFLGDSQTMTSEAAVLGVPALKCNTFAGRLSVPNEMERKYGLCYAYLPQDFDKYLAHVERLLNTPDLKGQWALKRERFLSDKINVSAFFTWFIENFPESRKELSDNPMKQFEFR